MASADEVQGFPGSVVLLMGTSLLDGACWQIHLASCDNVEGELRTGHQRPHSRWQCTSQPQAG